jgi:glutamyl/glutaminyl-tRNA synthetase
VAVRSYREKGFLAPALLNYLATLGWTAPSGKEILDLKEMVEEFELEDLHKSGAIFDIEKLRWYNRQYLLHLGPEAFDTQALSVLRDALEVRGLTWSDPIASALMPTIRERISVWEDLRTFAADGEFDYFFADPTPETARIPQKNVPGPDTITHLTKLYALLEQAPEEHWRDAESVKNIVWEYASTQGRGAVLWPLRYGLTGQERSPDPFVVSSIIGKQATLRRLESALNQLRGL